MIEAAAGDVQVAIVAAGFQALEAEQVVLIAGDERCQLRSPDLYAAAVGSDDEHTGPRALDGGNAIVRSLPLVLGELAERGVSVDHASSIDGRLVLTHATRTALLLTTGGRSGDTPGGDLIANVFQIA